jgi:hypothetical protein
MILHGFILQIIYTTDFQAKRLNNETRSLGLFDRLTRKHLV